MGKERIKQRVRRMSKAIIIVSVAFLLLLSLIITYSVNMDDKYKESFIKSISEISAVSSNSLLKGIDKDLYGLSCIADMIGRSEEMDVAQAISYLKTIDLRSKYKKLCVIDRDGMSWSTDDAVVDVSGRKYFELAGKGIPNVSDTVDDRVDGERINILAVPIMHDDRVIGILTGIKRNEVYRNELEIKTFEGEGYSYMVKKNGDLVIDSAHPSSFQNCINVYLSLSDADSDNTECIAELKRSLSEGRSGYIQFKNKVMKYLYYRPVVVNDWYLLTVVPASALESQRNFVMMSTYILCTGIILLFCLLLFIFLREQVRSRRVLENVLYVDPITGGISFEKFRRDAGLVLEEPESQNYAIIDIDIDKFKCINDAFGYEEGNEVIRYIWRMLKRFAAPGDIYAHKSADYFVALAAYTTTEELMERVEHFCESLNQNHKDYDKQYEIIPSIGIYEIHNYGKKMETMLDRAAIARQSVKGQHNQMYAIYDERLRQKLLREKYIEDRMSDALKNREFFVNYQPKYDSVTGLVTGAEALVRWKDGNGEIIMPSEFIPVFENNGFITELDKYVFRRVCENMSGWLEKGKNVMPVSVNLSRLHLYNINFIDEYVRMRGSFKIPAALVQLELTESALFEQEDKLTEVLRQLHGNGFRVLMDDFGTGYSCLHMLKNISVDVLKLDKKFVDDIGNLRSENVIDSIIKLAHSLQMKVTAEGVEMEMQYEFLKKASCDEIQGFYFSKPISMEEFELILGSI